MSLALVVIASGKFKVRQAKGLARDQGQYQ